MTELDETAGAGRARTQVAIVEAAARLLQAGGPGAVTTRAVAAAAGVQAPAIYRLFGDKDGLLDAVAEQVFAAYVRGKALGLPATGMKATDVSRGDPVEDLDVGWAVHIGFGLENPDLFAILADPRRSTRSPAAAAGMDVLEGRVHRIAAAGRLKVTQRRAVDLIHAAGTGVVLTLLAVPPERRDPGLAGAIYTAVKQAIIADVPTAAAGATSSATATATTAVALHADLANVSVLTGAERALLAEWLDRIADS